jgi:hypothetical protein
VQYLVGAAEFGYLPGFHEARVLLRSRVPIVGTSTFGPTECSLR